jgi:hypothetical protein
VLLVSYCVAQAQTDGSDAAFHLQDPDDGDYFLVKVFEDPDNGLPLFALDGGASACTWEVNTYHRSDPTLSVAYVGADNVAPDQPALFLVTVGNNVFYYEGGPVAGKWRPGWAATNLGYRSRDFALGVDSTVLEDGLVVSANGMILHGGSGIRFAEFGKGTANLLVEVRRGPEVYSFSAPKMTFAEVCASCNTCTRDLVGETSATVELGMTGPSGDRKIVYIRQCPSIHWSGDILNNNRFTVLAKAMAADEVVKYVAFKEKTKVLKNIEKRSFVQWCDFAQLRFAPFTAHDTPCCPRYSVLMLEYA